MGGPREPLAHFPGSLLAGSMMNQAGVMAAEQDSHNDQKNKN